MLSFFMTKGLPKKPVYQKNEMSIITLESRRSSCEDNKLRLKESLGRERSTRGMGPLQV